MNANSVWDAAGSFSDRIHKADKVRLLREQVHGALNTCGSCTAWMTRSCPREVHSNQTGRSQGPSSMSIKCEQFVISTSGARCAELAVAKIAELTKDQP